MVGRILKDRYQIEELVGEGGMALVFRARDAMLNRTVAVKVMRRELMSDPTFIERFRREAEAAAGLSHPHIATVFDFGEDNGDYFLVMEYLPSKNLKELIQERGALPTKIALDIAVQLADALKYAHSNGIIHRDVKPQNVLFTDDGKVKLTDFGIARAVSSQTPLTGTGQLVGSVHYMSPEQARGLGASERSDVYALGVMLFEMVSGRVPFDADTPVAVALKQVQEQPPPIREIDPSLPVALEYVISKALRKETTARYQTAQELMQDLVKVREGKQVAPSVPPAVEKAATAVLERRRLQGDTAVGRTVFAPAPPRPLPPPEAVVSPLSWVILFLTVLIVGGASAYIYFSRRQVAAPAPQMVLVPDLTGFARQSAVDELRRQGLLARINQEENVQAVPDTVLRQSPPAGTQLEQGSTVQVWVGTQPGAIQVPNLVGMPLDKAQTALNTLGLLLGATTYQASEEMEQGYVLKQNPPGGGQAVKGSAVDLVLAERKSSFPPMPPAPRPGGGEETTPPAPPKTTAEIVPLSVSEQDQAIGTKEVEVRITVAPGEGPDHRILIVLKDDEGERTVAQETLSPGSPYHEVFQAQGKATLKVLDNDQEIKSKSF